MSKILSLFYCEKIFLCYNIHIMKKAISIIVIIIMVAVLGITLAACNNATTQGQLANILRTHNYEQFVYEVSTTENDTKGTYTVTLQAYDKGADVANFGSATLTNVNNGVLVTSVLDFNGSIYNTGCYYNLISGASYMVPAYTYRVQTVNGQETFRLQGTYDGATLNYDRYINNGEKQSGSVSASGTFYDNNQFYQSLRTITTFATGLTFAFTMPLVSANEVASVNITTAISATEKIKTPFTETYTKGEDGAIYKEEGINCYRMSLSRTTDVEGLSHTAYYAVDSISLSGWGITHALVRIVENYKDANGNQQTMGYSLVSATLA